MDDETHIGQSRERIRNMPYTKKNGDGKTTLDWGKILEGIIGGVALVVVLGMANWFLVARDSRNEIRSLKQEMRQGNMLLRKDMKHGVALLGTQNSVIGKTVWDHIKDPKYPNQPCPWPELDFSFMDEETQKGNGGDK